MAIEKCRHLGIAAARRPPTEHDADHPAIAVLDGADEIEAGSVGIAGLDAVHALVAIHQIVVAADLAAAEAEALGGKRPVFSGKVAHQRDGKRRHLTRCRHLLAGRQAGGVGEDRLAHAELPRLGGHHPGEVGLGASEPFRHRRRRVVA
ncbi:hypothetical protein D9M72_469740 [compost metagenome]